jgi:hypothetical protein
VVRQPIELGSDNRYLVGGDFFVSVTVHSMRIEGEQKNPVGIGPLGPRRMRGNIA